MLKILSLIVGELGVNCYIPYCEQTRQCVVIDPGGSVDRILGLIKENNLQLKYILLTHGHFDHIGAVNELKEKTGARVAVHPEDSEMLMDPAKNLSSFVGGEPINVSADIMVEDGMELQVSNIKLQVIHTPGHTKGGVSYLGDGVIFTGDTLFAGSIGRTDLPGGNYRILIKSIREKLLVLDDNLVIYPGHGPSSTIGNEYASNPYLQSGEEFL